MNRGKVSTQVLLYFLMLMLMMVTVGCSSKDDDPVPATYSIAGTVTGAANVVINLTGAATATTTTSGAYSFTGRANGTYTVTPVLAGYTFEPASKVVVVNGSNMAGINFAATVGTGHALSGTVTGVGVSGATITLSGDGTGSVTTGTDGTYSFPNLPDGNYTVTPYHSGYAFTPDHRDGIILTGADSTGNDFVSEVANFTLADLEGTWDARVLAAGSESGWMRGTATADSDGNITFEDCVDDAGPAICPEGPIVWTIKTSTGEILETDDGNPTDSHYTMASNKKFIAGTQNQDGDTEQALLIAQKKVDGTVYAADDLYNKSFVFHQLFVGNYTDAAGWSYGAGSTNGSGLATSSSETNSWVGPVTPGSGGTLSVDPTGVVTISGDPSWNGFFSADKRTIVGVSSSTNTGGTNYTLMIIQVTNNQVSTLSQVVGISRAHMLVDGAYVNAPFWAHQTVTIASGGAITLSDWVCSNVSESGPGSTGPTMSISGPGTATVNDGDFHGQLSYDGTFLVGTQTYATDAFALMVMTK